MGSTWWSSADAEYLTLAEEHAATGGDHFGIVQTGCPVCLELTRLREERDPPVPETEKVRCASSDCVCDVPAFVYRAAHV